ncbi:hypothetical protein IV203_006510 [Nitzschia inconspicua]|uniref:Uncharacterized protein n=1 Tax=Nitzschia inconspicua TaxID=303405 RepID=A0A9K3PA38_9STRA|nr:hypothetical protein IV203_006623 [Nitzschia inconspicua]KAG7340106.1 hypothetical protein IV203_006510 [Nitzschia inconspicua]
MSVIDRSNKRMKGDGGPMGGPPPGPPESYYGQPGGRYPPPYGGPPPMGSGYGMWGQQGHPPPHAWGHGSPTPTPGSMYQRGGPAMAPSDRSGYGSAYPPRGPPPPMPGPGPTRRPGNPPGSSRSSGSPSEGPITGAPDSGPPYQGGYYPPPSAGPYGSSAYPPSGPPPMHHPSYSSGPSSSMYGNSPPRSSATSAGPSSTAAAPAQRPHSSPDLMNAYCQTTGSENPDLDSLYSSSRGVGPSMDDDGTGSTGGGGGSSKDKGRGSYKCGRCGVPKKGHVCPYQPKLTRRPGEPLPEMRSAAIQVEMDEFMTLRRLNLRIQGFPESYANEPYCEDMVIGEPALGTAQQQQHPSMTVSSPHGSGGLHDNMLNVSDNGPPPSLPSHDPGLGVLGSPIRSSPMSEDPISGAA